MPSSRADTRSLPAPLPLPFLPIHFIDISKRVSCVAACINEVRSYERSPLPAMESVWTGFLPTIVGGFARR